jgi:SAM-dependent methyltransferase
VLEIGCFDGALASFVRAQHPQQFFRWTGLEPVAAAAAIAKQRGVEIAGESLAVLANEAAVFDCVVAIDVFEHISSPRDLMETCHRLLKPGGLLIMATGAIDSVGARRQATWSYVAMPEHVCFMSAPFAKYIACHFNMALTAFTRFRHTTTSNALVLKLFVRSALSDALRFCPWQLFSRRLRTLRGQGWTPPLLHDHCLVCWKKNV